MELHNLIPPSPFHHRSTRRTAMRLRYTCTYRLLSAIVNKQCQEYNLQKSLGSFQNKINKMNGLTSFRCHQLRKPGAHDQLLASPGDDRRDVTWNSRHTTLN